ncbi:MAG: YigZ family protein [Anaerolineae bacterium]|nr:YigZ family protein [Anaerolineae bacterium]
MSRYPVPKTTAQIEYHMSNSRFITTVGRADTVEEARAFIHAIREEMPDASHHVYAFRVGYGTSVTEGMSDDGEPSGTSGPPALAVLRGSGIGDIVLVITRYFGGTKLGTGGLVYAYTNAAKEGVAALETEEKISRKLIGVTMPYSLYERVKRLLDTYDGLLDGEEFTADVTVYASFPEENIKAFTDEVRELSAGQVTPIVLDE